MDQFRWLIERRRSHQDRRRHLVQLTDAGAKQPTNAECLPSTVGDEVLGALDDSQRETLYTLLQQAATGTVVNCTEAIHD
jgi:DNA-binding MarR family transcriptional regulator